MSRLWRAASAVSRLESSPPDRKVETGTSATRCAATESSSTRAQLLTSTCRSDGAASSARGSIVPLQPIGGRPGRPAASCRAAACGRPGRRSGPRGPSSTSARPRCAVWSIGGRSPSRRPQALQLRGECEPPSRAHPEQRLDAELVAGQHERARCARRRARRRTCRAAGGRLAGPQRRHASSSTSVSELVRKPRPAACSSVRSCR